MIVRIDEGRACNSLGFFMLWDCIFGGLFLVWGGL